MSRYLKDEIIAEKYRLVRELGSGGMGAVWVAENLALEVPVALKLIRADIAATTARERLLMEARTAARIKHPSVVRIFDFGKTHHEDPFFVMELLTGRDLSELIEAQGRLLATEAVQLLLPVAEGLTALHRQAIVHRDLKPDNIFLAESAGRLQPKIVDFGIAKFKTEQSGSRITADGAVVGSPDYMSPEQARGAEDIDQRADIWAFSVVLYECLTGRLPFESANYNALLRRIIEEDPVDIARFSAGDADLWAILAQGLRKDRGERWQNISDFGEALAFWLLKHGVTEDACGNSLRATWLAAHTLSETAPASAPPRLSIPLNQRAASMLSMPSAPVDPNSFPPVSAGQSHSPSRGAELASQERAPARSGSSILLGGALLTVLGSLAALGLRATYTSAQGSRQQTMLAKGLVSSAPAKPERYGAVLGSTQVSSGQAIATASAPAATPATTEAKSRGTSSLAPSQPSRRLHRTKSTSSHKAPRSSNSHEDFGF